MISKNIQISNPLLYNITFGISDEINEGWLEDMKNDYLTAVTDGQIIVSTQINEVKTDSDKEGNTYAVQFIFASEIIFDQYGLEALDRFLKKLDRKYFGKYVYFVTKMEILHFFSKPSPN